MTRTSRYVGIGMVALVFVVFGRVLSYGFAPSDDVFLVVQNLAIRGITWENLRTVFTTYDPELYMPLTFVSYQIDYLMGGLQPFIYHLTNVVLHAVNSLLATWLLWLLTRKWWAAVIAGFLFAVHPIQTEAVVWIAGRKDLLSATFYLLAFIWYVRGGATDKRKYALSLLFFLLALFAKVMVLTLPFALLFYDYFLQRRRGRTMLLNKVPYLLLAAIFLIVALIGKERVIENLPYTQQFLLACKSTLFYLWKFVAPFGLTTVYPHNGAVLLADFWPYVPGVLGLLGIAYRARNRAEWLTFAILWYGLTLSPTFINVAKGGYIYFAVDRYMYLPILAVLLVVVYGVEKVRRMSAVHTAVAAAVLIALFSVLAYRQAGTWRSPERLYQHAVTAYPHSVPARASLARIYRSKGQYEQAFSVLQEGLKYSKHPSLYLGAGYVYTRVGQLADARQQFRTARELDPENPEPVFALGSLAHKTDDLQQAEQYYEQAIALDPSYVVARLRLAEILLQNGNVAAARNQVETALEWNANAAEVHDLYADILEQQGETKAASEHRSKAAALRKGGRAW